MPVTIEPPAPTQQVEPVSNLDNMEYLPLSFERGGRDEKKIVEYVKARYDQARYWDRPFKQSMLIDWQNRNSVLPSNWPYYWGIFEPETHITHNDTVERVMADILGKSNFFDVRGVSGQHEVQVEIAREVTKYNQRKAKYKTKMFFWFDDCVGFGNSVIGTGFEPRPRTEIVSQPIMDPHGYGFPVGQQRVKRDVTEIWASIYNISRWDFFPYPGPGYYDIQKMPYCVVRRFLPLSAVKAMAKWRGWANTDKLKGSYEVNRSQGVLAGSETAFEDIWKRLQYAGFDITTQQGEGPGCEKFCEVLFYYEAPPGQEGCRAHAVWAEDELLCCRANDFEHADKPLDMLMWKPLTVDLFQAQGCDSLIRPMQDKLNIRAGQKADLLEHFLKPTRLVGAASGIKPLTKLSPWPGSLIDVPGDINAVKLLEYPNVRGDIVQDDQATMMQVQRMSKMTNVSKGISDPGNGLGAQTGKGIGMLQDSTNQSVLFMNLWLENIGVEPQLNHFLQTIQQVVTTEQVIHCTDANEILKRAGRLGPGNSFTLRPDDIAGQFELYAVGSSKSVESSEWVTNLLTICNMARTIPEVASRLDSMEIFKLVFEAACKRNPSIVLKSDEKMQEDANIPRPLPPQSLVKYEKAPADIQRQIELREGFQPSQIGESSTAEQQGTKIQGELVKTAMKEHVKPRVQPKYLPQRDKS